METGFFIFSISLSCKNPSRCLTPLGGDTMFTSTVTIRRITGGGNYWCLLFIFMFPFCYKKQFLTASSQPEHIIK